MFTCKGTKNGFRDGHSHEFVFQAKACYGVDGYAPTTPTHTPAVLPFKFGSRMDPTGPLSEPQYKFISDLKGDLIYAKTLTYYDASCYITRLKGGYKVNDAPTSPAPPDPKVEMLKSLMSMVPIPGYYAVEEYDGGHVEFIRLSVGKTKQYADAIKVQTLHGNFGPEGRKDIEAVFWPSGKVDLYKREHKIVDWLLLLVADAQGAASRYAEKSERCCRCNAKLTLGRSRWFEIGPECENYWPQHMEAVRVRKGEFTGEN